jgi:hypothetical protein
MHAYISNSVVLSLGLLVSSKLITIQVKPKAQPLAFTYDVWSID